MISVPQTFFRLSGWALIVSGILISIVQFVHLDDTPANMAQLSYFVKVAVWTHVALSVSVALMLFGLVGLFLRGGSAIRWWGWLGFAFMFATFFFDVMHAALQIYDYPIVFGNIQNEQQLKEASDFVMKAQLESGIGSALMQMLMPLSVLGTPLMAIALLRARIVPKWAAIAQIALLLLMFVPIPGLMAIVFPVSFLVYAIYGAALAFGKRSAAQSPQPVHPA
ncbi:hypothetical protein SD70_12290 [Gordoniibacillus kamchatkensis]|uniref:DUF4386 domain-containing protein n=1 Tax=Gordoniibacillus kamchatkensis TaxID=1590651 RepID=A0ABR5AI15_9BACL|nr:hypothetical protein [Paenibacillus sp. VKM B-2647]KIL40678.1 hypothetical protein SD70_12290 [Paenibacillus sp. VKM B-2647]